MPSWFDIYEILRIFFQVLLDLCCYYWPNFLIFLVCIQTWESLMIILWSARSRFYHKDIVNSSRSTNSTRKRRGSPASHPFVSFALLVTLSLPCLMVEHTWYFSDRGRWKKTRGRWRDHQSCGVGTNEVSRLNQVTLDILVLGVFCYWFVVHCDDFLFNYVKFIML